MAANTSSFEMYFRDRRPPHHVLFELERRTRTLFERERDSGGHPLAWRRAFTHNGVAFDIRLVLVAALPEDEGCICQIRFDASWPPASQQPQNQDYYRKSTDGWIAYWIRDLMPCSPPDGTVDIERYRSLAAAAESAEAHLTGVPAIQQEILRAMREEGAGYATSHKEGGAHIRFHHDRFIRADYGESTEITAYRTDAEFLAFLRQFYDWEVSRSRAAPVSEYAAWKMILRFLHRFPA